MGYGDNEPPAIRADAFPATLGGPSGFRLTILTFVSWDVIKFAAVTEGESPHYLVIESGRKSTEFLFQPTRSHALYTLTAQGCDRAIDESTSYCSPTATVNKWADVNTGSLRQLLLLSGVELSRDVALRAHLSAPSVSLRTLMCL